MREAVAAAVTHETTRADTLQRANEHAEQALTVCRGELAQCRGELAQCRHRGEQGHEDRRTIQQLRTRLQEAHGQMDALRHENEQVVLRTREDVIMCKRVIQELEAQLGEHKLETRDDVRGEK